MMRARGPLAALFAGLVIVGAGCGPSSATKTVAAVTTTLAPTTTTTTLAPTTTTTEAPPTTTLPATTAPLQTSRPQTSPPRASAARTSPPQTSPPATTAPAGNGATARCNDGTYSYAAHHQGACSHHRGVAVFYNSRTVIEHTLG